MDLGDVLAQMDERLAQMDVREAAAAARHETLLAKMDERLAKMDERLARQDEILAQLVTLTDIARPEAAAHQATALALTRYAETRLDIDRFLTTAERVLTAWERQRR
jgi:hypothetical protein